jgi:preprotein translocase subunit SecG
MVALFFIIGIALAVLETAQMRELKKGVSGSSSEIRQSEQAPDKTEQ